MRKLLEALFRHKRLVLLPPILILLLVAPVVLYTMPVYYESVAGVWVDQPAYLTVKDGAGGGYTSPALSRSNELTELLHTRSFMLDVAQRTPLASVLQTKGGDARVQDMFDKNLTVAPAPSGTHLITIRFRAATPQLAAQVTQAVLDAYSDRMSAQQLDQSSVAISFYQSQVQDAQDTANQATQKLGQYAVAMGYASDGDTPAAQPQDGTLSPSALDPKFAELQSAAHAAQQQLDSARAALQQAQENSAAAAQGSQVGFQVIDPPQVPTAPSTQLKNVIIYIGAALVVGLGISIMLLVFLVAGDRSVRRDADFVPPVRVLGVVPVLKLKRVPKGARQTAARRAIGFVAGTALPSPRVASR